MINGKKVLALITARGGSKGIPGKNIRPLANKPLIGWSVEAALSSSYVDRVIVSSDSPEIIQVAQRFGAEAPFVRPESLSRDDTPSMDVVIHALDTLHEEYDYLILLQPTSPFRDSSDIDAALRQADRADAVLVVSVAPLKKHPMFMFEIVDGKLAPFIDNKGEQLRRQDMPQAYEHNGAIYIARVPYIRKCRSFNTPEAEPYIMNGPANLDIDTPEDWESAERLAARLYDA